MTEYVLSHATGKDIILVYDGPHGISQRTIRICDVNDSLLRGVEDGKMKSFRRDRVLAASWDAHASDKTGINHGRYKI